VTEIIGFLKDSNLLTPSILAIFMAAIFYQQNKSIVQLQGELKAISASITAVSQTLATTVAVLSRIDEYGTKAEMSHRENCQGRWESRDRKTI
jgi:Na+/melibiose symporter-like transporter